MILFTGAGGAIGSRVVERLVAEGVDPVVAGRRAEALRRRWPDLRAVELDVLKASTLERALEGVRCAYYLVHSMEPGAASFEQRDRIGAANFAHAARAAGVERVIYLGGLGEEGTGLSTHLSSRHETGRILAAEGPPLIEFRAAMVVGRDSASFRMLGDLVSRLPVMVVPRWVDTPSQPIAIRDVVAYLAAGRDLVVDPLADPRTIVEIGGAQVVSYRDMLEIYARLQGRSRMIVGVPLLTPRLSSMWCGLTTSVSTAVARPLIDGMTHPMLVTSDAAQRLFPDIHPVGFEQALRQAFEGE